MSSSYLYVLILTLKLKRIDNVFVLPRCAESDSDLEVKSYLDVYSSTAFFLKRTDTSALVVSIPTFNLYLV